MLIKTDNLSYVYSPGTPMEQKALHDINLTIEKGEFTGIIGHTGSGKSTLIQHFNALLYPTAGRVLIDGIDTAQNKNKLKDIRQKVGLVFQYPEHQLFEETVAEDIAFGPKNLNLSEQEVEERIKSAMETVALPYEEFKDRSPFELSGGQMRRVAIAGVLAMRPEVLIMDEPTAGLDPQGRRAILDQIRSFHKELGLTIILVTHSMEDVARLAERLIVMHQGKIHLDNSPGEIFMKADTLESLGLGVPEVTSLMQTLQKQGYKVPADVFTLERAKQELLPLLQRKWDDGDV
ncbi:energy-coupling factor transporter ATPase [Natranaerobius thermophilus]|uniref:Energy-coupling factor transporter ATP-binding protein EcfA2 n=1 Tax=Natranaerobius thermophilus (strain ATCC BAA-1301 / DSM 18059 / JW/NM-WN-LF) TaxID=457570 RepID=B2A4Q3_NATTJ|nr:energy-coupling factor transporter ATPase [Natranaerobius thermophilus]ACB83825.1 ABC transporter related [Natranaerobius thermophilus JW/NM-WN-LF]